jgi:GntR family transcriptional regulator/MocR family aminotransferase
MPLHERIQRAIRRLILDGALGPGKPLPASRALAKTLGVSRDTIEAAYAQLHAEGFIDRHVGSGSFVAQITEFAPGRALSQRDALLRNQAPNLSKRGNAMFRSGGVRELLVPRPFAWDAGDTQLSASALGAPTTAGIEGNRHAGSASRRSAGDRTAATRHRRLCEP